MFLFSGEIIDTQGIDDIAHRSGMKAWDWHILRTSLLVYQTITNMELANWVIMVKLRKAQMLLAMLSRVIMAVPMVGFSVACLLKNPLQRVLAVQSGRANACRLLRQKLAQQKNDCELGLFSVPFAKGSMARQPSMPMIPLCD